LNVTYLLPIRRTVFRVNEAAELLEYLSILNEAGCETVIVDGSPPDVFAQHHRAWTNVCRHEPVDRRYKFLNDKVNGVHTGVALATNDKIILADDDIRYTKIDIEQTCALLDEDEVVRPQNYIATNATPKSPHLNPLPQGEEDAKRQVRAIPVWAKMEAARMLINRATLRNADYPGTCAFRKATMLRCGEYDGDVLFDNEEIVRHFARHNARICYANNFFVRKRPPTFRKWLEQRPRQAYEDFGLRFKTFLFASLLPIAIILALINSRWLAIFSVLGGSILLALGGWLRGSARNYFPFHVCLFAPLWIVERTLSTYWAFYWLLTRGGYPFGDRVLTKGIGRDWVEGGKIAASTSRE
jgi:hypothetical protein